MKSAVHFSNIKNEILAQLKKATQDIKVAVAWFTDEDIIRTLKQRVEKGVAVSVVLSDSKENFRNIAKWKEYLKYGGKLHIATPNFLHHKFCVIDGITIINGSYNWTYYAQKNEENVLILTLDNSKQEEHRISIAFEAKFRYYCDKASTLITDISELNQFKVLDKIAAREMSKIDEDEIILRQELEDDVKKSFNEAKRIGISISEFLLDRMKLDGGGVEFIKRILYDEMTSGEMKSGFKKLEEPIPHRVDLSLEHLASRPKYQKLFSQQEIEFCQILMQKYKL